MFVAGIILLALGILCEVIGAVAFGAASNASSLESLVDGAAGGVAFYVIGIILICVGTPLFIVGLVKKIKRNNAAKAAAAAPQYQVPQYQAPQYQQPQQPQQPQAKTCPQCGAVVPAGNAFCPNCGATIQ